MSDGRISAFKQKPDYFNRMYLPYVEYPPHPGLRAFVECFWTIRGDIPVEGPLLNRVLPDGCMDIIFDLERGGSWVIGPMSSSIEVQLYGRVDLLGARFQPGGLPLFIRHPAHRLLDTRGDLAAVWGSAAKALIEGLIHEPPVSARIDMLNTMLLRRRPSSQPHAVAHAVAMLQNSGGGLPIHRIVDQLQIGRRQLERLFAEHVGLSPKQTARIIRFRRAVEALFKSETVEWAQFALDRGYYDQAHFIRDFRAFAGVTPEAYRLERSQRLHVASVQS